MKRIEISNIKLFGNPKIQYRDFSEAKNFKEILDIIKRPFITTKEVILKFILNKKTYLFPIKSGFIYDGATIIRILVPFIGLGTDVRFMKAALIHDYFLDYKSEIYPKYFKSILSVNNYIYLTSQLFKNILIQNYVSKLKSNIMTFCVTQWQKSIFNKKMWKCLNEEHNKENKNGN